MRRLYPLVNAASREHYPQAIPPLRPSPENSKMDKYEARRQRLRQLIDEKCEGVSSAFAKQIGRDASYVTRMLYPDGKKGRKRIADDMMEIIETAFDLPRGWLDGIERTVSYPPSPALRVAEPTPEPSAQLIAEPTPEPSAQLIAEHAAALAEQAARVAQLWMQLPPARRADYLAALAAEVSGGDTAGTRVAVGRRTSPAQPSKSTGKP